MEQLKAFLATPPVIEQLVFKKKVPHLLRGQSLHDIGISTSTNYEFGAITWQPGAFYQHIVPDIGDVISNKLTGSAAILYGHDYWVADFWRHSATYGFLDTNLVLLTATNRVARLVNFHEREQIGEVLNLGVCHLLPGEIKWRTNEFIAESLGGGMPLHIHGWLDLQDGKVRGMWVEYITAKNISRYFIRYDYGTNAAVPAYLPSRTTALWQRNGREIPIAEITLLALRTREAPLPKGRFEVASYIQTNRFQVCVLTNDTLYARSASGSLTPLRRGQPFPGSEVGEDFAKNRYFYTVVAATTVAFFILLVRMKTHSKQPQI